MSGQNYAEYVKEHIFAPMGIQCTTADLEIEKKSDIVNFGCFYI